MKKRILCIALAFAILLSFTSCVTTQKYDYKNLGKYITIPSINGHEIKVELDMVQMTIDQDIASLATDKITAQAGDTVNVVITLQKYVVLGKDEAGNDIDQKGETIYTSDDSVTTDVKETITILNLGGGNFLKGIEDRIIKSKLGENTIENDYIIPPLEDMANLQTNYPHIYEKLAPYTGQRMFLSYSFTSRPVKEGDVVSVTYTGYKTDTNGNILIDSSGKEVTFEGGSGTSKVYIGSRTFIVDFEKGLIGLPVGKEGQFKATFPSDYGVESLNGTTVIFKATVNAIYQTPEYNAEYIKTNYGDKYATVEDFENALIDSYAAQQIVEYLVSNSTVHKYPKKEYKIIKQQLEQSASSIQSQYKMTLEEYVKANGFASIDDYIYNVMKAELAYYAYAQQYGIVVTDADIANAKAELIDLYKEQYKSNSSTLTDSEALQYATEYVETLTNADLHQEALYGLVGEHIMTQYVLVKVEPTYTSVTKGGSLSD